MKRAGSKQEDLGAGVSNTMARLKCFLNSQHNVSLEQEGET